MTTWLDKIQSISHYHQIRKNDSERDYREALHQNPDPRGLEYRRHFREHLHHLCRYLSAKRELHMLRNGSYRVRREIQFVNCDRNPEAMGWQPTEPERESTDQQVRS